MKKLFQYAVLWHPTEKQEKEGANSKILKEVSTILAKDTQSVAIRASMEISPEYKDELDQIEIAIRPF
jgi:hypothetical protein